MSEPDFSAVQAAPEPGLMDNVLALVDRVRELNKLKDAAERQLEEVTAQLDRLVRRDIPDAMEALSLTEVKLTGGAVLKVKGDVNVSITRENSDAALQWLRDKGHGSIIKEEVAIDLRGLTAEQREELSRELNATSVEHHINASVHPATLKALVKEMLQAGVGLPPTISVYQYRKAELKEPKR